MKQRRAHIGKARKLYVHHLTPDQDGRRSNRGRTGILISATFTRRKSDGQMQVSWTCPKCGHRNENINWYGREQHICSSCEQWTDIKGEAHPPEVLA